MMAKLIYAAISSLDGYVADADGNFAGARLMRRCTGSSTTWSAPLESISTGVGCMRRCASGRPRLPGMASHPRDTSSRRSGGRHLFLCPVVVGGGLQTLPDKVRLRLELLNERRFGNGVVHLHYRIAG